MDTKKTFVIENGGFVREYRPIDKKAPGEGKNVEENGCAYKMNIYLC